MLVVLVGAARADVIAVPARAATTKGSATRMVLPYRWVGGYEQKVKKCVKSCAICVRVCVCHLCSLLAFGGVWGGREEMTGNSSSCGPTADPSVCLVRNGKEVGIVSRGKPERSWQ